MAAEYMVLNEEGALVPPAHLTDEEAATLPCAALTAWNALACSGNVKAGDTDHSVRYQPDTLCVAERHHGREEERD